MLALQFSQYEPTLWLVLSAWNWAREELNIGPSPPLFHLACSGFLLPSPQPATPAKVGWCFSTYMEWHGSQIWHPWSGTHPCTNPALWNRYKHTLQHISDTQMPVRPVLHIFLCCCFFLLDRSSFSKAWPCLSSAKLFPLFPLHLSLLGRHCLFAFISQWFS